MEPRAFDQFVRDQICSRDKEVSVKQLDPRDCHEVTQVVAGSPAAMLGVDAGDLVFRADGRASASHGPSFEAAKRHPSRYEILPRDGTTPICVETTGIDLGMRVQRTPDAIASRWRLSASMEAMEELSILWEMGRWVLLEKLTRPRWTDILEPRHFFSRNTPLRRHSAVALLNGVAEFEAGDRARGQELIVTYLQNNLGEDTSIFGAIALYYLSILHAEAGEVDDARSVIADAWSICPRARIADLYTTLHDQSPPPRPRLAAGRPFPMRYDLPVLAGAEGGTMSLDLTLAEMPEGAVHIICAMAEYRANGPYFDVMKSYIRWKQQFGPWIHGVHVLTTEPDREAGIAPNWIGSEDEAIRKKTNVVVGHDVIELNHRLNVRATPYLFFVDKTGEVVHEATDPTGNDIWTALAVANGQGSVAENLMVG